jgi:hypothetical protein
MVETNNLRNAMQKKEPVNSGRMASQSQIGTSIPMKIVGNWFVNGEPVAGLKRHVQTKLVEWIDQFLDRNPKVDFDKYAMLGRNGSLTLSELRTKYRDLNTRTITRILAVLRRPVTDLFATQFADDEKYDKAEKDVIVGFQELNPDSMCKDVAAAFMDREESHRQADVAVCLLRAIDEANATSSPRHETSTEGRSHTSSRR